MVVCLASRWESRLDTRSPILSIFYSRDYGKMLNGERKSDQAQIIGRASNVQ